MPVTYVTNSTAVNDAFDVPRPTGYDATYPSAGTWGPGDLVLHIGIWYDDAASTYIAPSGFTQPPIKRVANHTNIIVVEASWKIAGASEPTSYNASGTAEADYDEGIVLILRGTDQTTPVGAFSVNSGSGTTVTWLGLTPPRNDSLSVFIHGGYNNPAAAIGGTPTATERINGLDGVNDVSTAAYTTADTGDRTATKSSDTWNAIHINFQPPGGAAATSDPGSNASRRNIARNAIYRMAPQLPAAPVGFKRRDRIYVPAHLAA